MLFTILEAVLVVVEVLTCILLIGVVLIQKSKQHGAGMAFGSGMGETLFGGQVTGVLTRFTVIVASVFLVNTALLTLLTTRRARSSSGVAVKVDKTAKTPQAAPGGAAPVGGSVVPSPSSVPVGGAADLPLEAARESQPAAAVPVTPAPVPVESPESKPAE